MKFLKNIMHSLKLFPSIKLFLKGITFSASNKFCIEKYFLRLPITSTIVDGWKKLLAIKELYLINDKTWFAWRKIRIVDELNWMPQCIWCKNIVVYIYILSVFTWLWRFHSSCCFSASSAKHVEYWEEKECLSIYVVYDLFQHSFRFEPDEM